MAQPDLKLSQKHDLEFVNNDLQLTSGLEAISQSVKQRLKLWQGNWFLNESEGVPYLQQVFIKGADLAAVQNLLLLTVAKTVGIADILSFSTSPQPNRGLLLEFVATTSGDGAILSVETTVGA